MVAPPVCWPTVVHSAAPGAEGRAARQLRGWLGPGWVEEAARLAVEVSSPEEVDAGLTAAMLAASLRLQSVAAPAHAAEEDPAEEAGALACCCHFGCQLCSSPPLLAKIEKL